MRRYFLPLLLCLLLALPALAEEAAPEMVTVTTPEGLSVTHAVNHPADTLYSDAELLVQHECSTGDYERAFQLNTQLYALGDHAAAYRLGCHYLSGLGTEQDASAALAHWGVAKAAGNAEATRALVLARLNGWGMPQDTVGAVAEMNGLNLYQDLALLYLHGAHDIPAHETTALHWFDQRYGTLKESLPQKYEELLAAFLASAPDSLTAPPPVQMADWDNPVMQAWAGLALGQFWQEGRGGVTDPLSAAYWYEFTTTLSNTKEASWAHAFLGDMHLSGALGEINVEKAMTHFLQDVYDVGYGPYRVGRMYWDGVTAPDGTVLLEKNIHAAMPYLTDAAEKNNEMACKLLGDAYRTGDQVSVNLSAAAHYYALGLKDTRAADCYEPLLDMYQAGLLYDRTVMEEIAQGLKYWRGADHQLGILLSEHWLNGLTAEDGTVLVAQDRRAAFQLMDNYRNEHAHLHPEPEVYFLNWLGWFYSGNAPEAVDRNYAKALDCYMESAQVGNGYAMAMVGVFYQNGRGMPVDHMTARAWYKRAIEAGYTGAQGYLDALNSQYPEYPVDQAVTIVTSSGLTLTHVINPTAAAALTDAELVMQGLCIDGRWEEALEINDHLAQLGDVEAMKRLGQHYASGLGVQQDDALAVEWLRKAADAGSEDAVFSLSAMYLGGWGVTQDAFKASAMLESLTGAADIDPEMLYLLSTLYKAGYASLPPDEALARQTYERYAASLRRKMDAEQSKALLEERQAYLTACTAPDVLLTTRPAPALTSWQTPDSSVYTGLGEFWREGCGGLTDIAEAVRWYELTLQHFPREKAAMYALAEIYRDGSAGYCDVQRSIALFCGLGEYEEVAAMFDTGVTGPDGQVSLAPNAIIAEAFRAWVLDPGNTVAGARLGDLFRDGSIVTANPDIAASFYWAARESQYCLEQLTALAEAGKITDSELLIKITGE